MKCLLYIPGQWEWLYSVLFNLFELELKPKQPLEDLVFISCFSTTNGFIIHTLSLLRRHVRRNPAQEPDRKGIAPRAQGPGLQGILWLLDEFSNPLDVITMPPSLSIIANLNFVHCNTVKNLIRVSSHYCYVSSEKI